MSVINAAAQGVDRGSRRYTVYVPPKTAGGTPKYVVYDKLAEAKAEVDKNKFGAVYRMEGGRAKRLYQAQAMSTFTAPAAAPHVHLAPAAAHPAASHAAYANRANTAGPLHTTAHHPAAHTPAAHPTHPKHAAAPKAWSWLTGPKPTPAATAKKLGVPSAGSVAIGKVTPTAHGADIQVHVASINGGDSVTIALGGQFNGSWSPFYNIPKSVGLAKGWHTLTLHVSYDEVNKYLQSVNPNMKVQTDMDCAVGLTFGTGHNTGIPGWSSNSGTEKDALLKLPAKHR